MTYRCCHWSLCKSRVKDVLAVLEGEKVVKFTPENLEILQKALDKVNELIATDLGSLVDDKKDRMREKARPHVQNQTAR